MQDLIVSINNNTLRISLIDKDAVLKNAVVEVSQDIVNDSQILNPQGLSLIIGDLIPTLTSLKTNKLRLNFILQPQDVFLRFVTISKGNVNIGDQIISEIKVKEPDILLDDLYFSYRKLAPFVYQFVGVEKKVLNSFLEISNILGISLRSIIPWVLVLPKYEKVNDPAVFVADVDGNQIIALSELNGIFFSGVYKDKKTTKELSSLIKDLSFYKKSTPIKYIFTLNCESFEVPGYEIKIVESPKFSDGSRAPVGMEINTIVNFLIDSDPSILEGQSNFLNMLPLPVEKKNTPLVVVGSVVGALLLLAGVYFGVGSLGNKNSVDTAKLAQQEDQMHNQEENAQVLSESVEEGSTENNDNKETDPNIEVQKGNLKIRIENGAGINGLAARTKEFLQELGYTILTIDTADERTEPTILQFKKDALNTYKDLVVEDIKEKFPNIEVKDDLPEDSDYDLLMILGTSSGF